MDYTPLSPFRRPISCIPVQDETPALPVQKWHILRDLAAGQAAFDLGPRELGVLQALLSFLPGDQIGPRGAVVFPSNKTLSERLNFMPESTLRRHLARLVASGLITRRDSPNGKRYASRANGAYGFDLSPLPRRAAEIQEAAEAARAQKDALSHLRETVSLMRRDLAAVLDYGRQHLPGAALWAKAEALCQPMQALRRLKEGALTALAEALSTALSLARALIESPAISSINDSQNERHHLNSNKDSCDSEPCAEEPRLPLQVVTQACPALAEFYAAPIRSWHHLCDAADRIRPAMGIGQHLWNEARRVLGTEQSAVVLAAMLQRFGEIRSPGAYLRRLTAKAAAGAFSCGPMIRALSTRC